MTYLYHDAHATHANNYLWPTVRRIILERTWETRLAFDVGCGNGATCNMLSGLGFNVSGVDVSLSGIEHARASYPHIKFEVGSAYEDLVDRFGVFDLVVSLEVIEHCMEPRSFARTFLSLIAPGGLGIISTPYHGYLKNIALAVTGKMDDHFTALWDGGHVKFFSENTLNRLLRECGARQVKFDRVGRIPALAKSMIAIISAEKSK